MRNLGEVGKGAMNFASQFKPLGLAPQSAKALLMTDVTPLSTPADSYFAYLNKRKQMHSLNDDEEREIEVLTNLGLQKILPSYYNILTNKFEIESSDEQLMRDLREIIPDPDTVIDPVELARINALRQKTIEKLIASKSQNNSGGVGS